MAAGNGYEALDLLATMVAIVRPDGQCLFANASFESHVGLPRRVIQRGSLPDWFADPTQLRETLAAVARNDYTTGRFDALLRRSQGSAGPPPAASSPAAGGPGTDRPWGRFPGGAPEPLPVQVIVTQMDAPERVLVEMIEVEQQTRQEREERALGQVQANKELIRNLAHEIKNPLGGIRGAAQLLGMELEAPELTEYTEIIVKEADRLQALVDRLLAPHRRPPVVGDVNVHEVCERVRALVMAQFPRGLSIERDYDISIPEFRGDRELLIQAVLNIALNAAQALGERIATGDAIIVLRTRIARQVTIGKTRFRLALELHIEDNGPGIPESIRERIFYPLVSGRDDGSGLGLTLAQTFVQQHHGTIECDSVPGRTVFKILIPLP